MTEGKAVIILGSEKDLDFTRPCMRLLERFGVNYDLRVASAHKTPEKVLQILKQYEGGESVVYITVAGRSNALSGLVDGNTDFPVIACPPYSDKFGGADVFSSLRMPSGIGPLVVLDPENAALSAAKILALEDRGLSEKISSYREELRDKIEETDREVG